ncbi:MAG: fluoride efflux transporter CrcB [Verrucomicrobiota bacterium]
MTYFWVALGGALGSVSRYWLNGLISSTRFGETFPWGTLAINVTGSFVIGVIGAFTIPEGRMDSQSRAFATQFLMYGICGGYTTFSSFSLQTLNLLRDREWLYAGGNVVLSVVLCLAAVWLGWMLGSMVNSMKGN